MRQCVHVNPKLLMYSSPSLFAPEDFFLPAVTLFFFFFQVAFSVKQIHLQCPVMLVMTSEKEKTVCPRHIFCLYCECDLPGARNWRCPSEKAKASLWLHAKVSGLTEATREQAVTSAIYWNMCQGQEKKGEGNPTERCTLSCRDAKDASPSFCEWPHGGLFSMI